ncbi:sensor histidine kinase [Mesonia maritima]|uniref:histidine kinase n=1 Tax=Mesonia maritima TaxID=1793873 RepID=A0ABU1K911_9FLAO|nr:HAMP domain-containing sensor histidine kinase [Mesonia maritima]MDR6300992.1 signal transduction histidine kinase [Mesonia maritima]
MKLKVTWLIVISVIAFIALSVIQGYLIYNTYTLKRNAFIQNTRSEILNIDYNKHLDSIVDTWEETLKNQIADYKNKRTTKQIVLNKLRQKADSLNSNYYNLYKEELAHKDLGYAVSYKKNIESIVIFDKENDTIFPLAEQTNFKLFGNDFQNSKANSVSVSRTFSQYDYIDQTENKINTQHYNLEIKFKDLMYIKDKNSIVFKQMLGLLIGSLFLFVVMLGLFYYSLKSLMAQKKISAVKTDFINNITHELKTPLATLGIATKSLKNQQILSKPETLQNSLAIIDRQNERIQKLIDQVMTNSLKAQHLKLALKNVEIIPFLNHIVEDFKLSVEAKPLQIAIAFNHQEKELKIDPFYFSTAIFNLLDNAVKYSKEKAKIKITTDYNNNCFFLVIKDEGIGIPKKEQQHLFEKFYRVSSSNLQANQGLGLGLYYTQQIILAHQGTIKVKSEKSKGSTFTIKIPKIQ